MVPDPCRGSFSHLMAGRWFVTQIEWFAPEPLKPGTPLRVELLFRDLSSGAMIPVHFTTAA
jgi:hypothetical protein